MSTILELTAQLRGLSAAIATHESAIASSPSPSLMASLKSLQKRMERLQAEFNAATADRGVDVCRYRFLSQISTPVVNQVCESLVAFQSAYTLAFDAVKNGRKMIARLSPDVVDQTALGFGYSFSGSLGIALTFDNKRLGFLETLMDDAMTGIFGLAKASTSEEVEKFGRQLGAPTLKAVYQWAKSHVNAGIGVDVQWVRGEQLKSQLTMETSQLSKLMDVLNQTSEQLSDIIVVEGIVAGGEHISRHNFHFIADDGTDIKGTYTDAISEERPVKWPTRYKATIKRTTKIFYTTDTQDAAVYFLISLQEIG